jgi:type IV secretory pathway TraG/TraD family ATPase VirD4
MGKMRPKKISSLCGTRIFFREPSSETAKWVAKELGNAEIEEVQEGMSYSESAMRSGITMGKNQLKRELVHPSDIMKLQNLEAYVRLLGNLPITKIKLEIKERKDSVKHYIPLSSEEKTSNDETADKPSEEAAARAQESNTEPETTANNIEAAHHKNVETKSKPKEIKPKTEKADINNFDYGEMDH